MKNFNTDEFLKSLEPLYLENQWEEAITRLNESRELLDPWIYHYNAGTLYSNMQSYGAGRYHLEKALMYPGDRSLVMANLDFVLDKLGPIDFSFGLTQLESWAIYLLGFPEQYAILISILLLILFSVVWRFRPAKRWYTFMLCVLLAVVSVALDQFWVRTYSVGIVIEDVEVRIGPSEIFEEKTKIRAGTKLLFRSSESAQWYQIIKPQRFIGWIPASKSGLL
jgi:hypothetical protein